MTKVSIITVCRNSEEYIEDAIKSVLSQDYPDIEYIVIDGASTDSTLEKIKKYEERIAKIISEPDKGMYDALNKGIRMASGGIIGILNSDDVYAYSGAVSEIVNLIEKSNVDSGWGDLVYVSSNMDRVIRKWKSSPYAPGKFSRGWHPPHPTFFVRNEVYERFGNFNTNFRIAADYEIMLRFLEKNKISFCYLPKTLVKMRWGGMSNRPSAVFKITLKEDMLAWQVNGLKGFLGSFITALIKKVSKIKQFLK